MYLEASSNWINLAVLWLLTPLRKRRIIMIQRQIQTCQTNNYLFIIIVALDCIRK